MKFKTNSSFAWAGIAACVVFWILLTVYLKYSGAVFFQFTAILALIAAGLIFILKRSYILLEADRMVIYYGIQSKKIPYGEIKLIKEARAAFMSQNLSFGVCNLGIKLKDASPWRSTYFMVGVKDKESFLDEVGRLQPEIEIIRKNRK